MKANNCQENVSISEGNEKVKMNESSVEEISECPKLRYSFAVRFFFSF